MLYEQLDSIGDEHCLVIEQTNELQHYLQRAYCHAQLHNHLDIIENLQKYFPLSMKLLIKGTIFSNVDHHHQLLPNIKGTKKMPAVQKKSLVASMDMFNPKLSIPMTFLGPKLNVGELENAADEVANGVLTFHRNLEHVDLSWPFSVVENQQSVTSLAPVSAAQRNLQLQPMYSTESSSAQAVVKGCADHFDHNDRLKVLNKTKQMCPKTGFDVVNGFAKGRLKQHELIYLNYYFDCDCRHFNPYNLVVVLPYEVKPEHYVASRFGFFNIHPDGSTDPIPFSVWCRDAALFLALRKIPFFKNYLIRKMLSYWRANAHYSQFIRMHKKIEQTHLQYFPGVPQALLMIVKLIHELLSLKFYSFKPLKKYTLEDLEASLQTSHSIAEHYLKKFFKYCYRIVSAVVESSHQKVSELEKILYHQPTVFEGTSSSMSNELSKRRKLEKDLQQARYQATRMGDLTTLVNQMLHHSLLQLAKENSAHYLNLLLQRESIDHLVDDSSSDSSIADSYGSNSSSHSITSIHDHQVVDSALLLAKLDFDQKGMQH